MSQAIVKASARREERLGDNLLDEMGRIQSKAWELLAKTESEGDHRASIVALREVRECLGSLGEMLSRAAAETVTPLTGWSNDDLWAELGSRGEERTSFVIRFERAKDGKPCDCPCCTADRNGDAS